MTRILAEFAKKHIDKLREGVFEKLFESAEIAKFTPEQIRSYEDILKYYRDLKNPLDTAREEGKIEVAEEMINAGEPVKRLSDILALPRNR